MAKATSSKAKKSIFTLENDIRKKLKAVSVMTEKDMQDIVNESLREWINKYEKKNGTIPTN